MHPTVRLKAGRDRAVRAGHPWVFSGAIDGLDAAIPPGSVVDLAADDGTFLGRGYLNPTCTIAVRVLTRADEPIDATFVGNRVRAAIGWRTRCLEPETTAYRLLNGEGDGLPGVVADVYGGFVVLQVLTAGAESLKPWLLDAIAQELEPRGIFERSAGGVRREEGLPQIEGVVFGEEPPIPLEVGEHGHRFLVDVRAGQKTGFFLDQRPNRALTQQLARGTRVLNAFAYTGSFGVYVGAGGARRVVSVESSERALDLARRHWARNGLPEAGAEFVDADVFTYLRQTDETFDLLILDPPALVKHRADLQRGARAYKDLNLQALRRTATGGLILTFTCSQHVDTAFFRKIVASAAADARRRVQVLQALGPGWDHPGDLAHPEGEYLRGLLLRVGS